MSMSKLDTSSLDDEDVEETVHGFLFYKHNSSIKKQFSKFWFSLHGYKLFYFDQKVKSSQMACTMKTQLNAAQVS